MTVASLQPLARGGKDLFRPAARAGKGPWRFIFICCLVALVLLATGYIAYGASGQATVEFDGVVEGNEDGTFTVTDNVRFTSDDITIRADKMVLEDDGETAQFYDNVVVTTSDYSFQGERFVYHMDTEMSLLFKPSGELEVPAAEGPVYYTADSLAVQSDRVVLNGARFTTCACEKPGYYLAGSRMEIIPGQVLIMHHVRFVESGITFFYWPWLAIPLTDGERPPFQLPQIGHNASEGWFVKLSIPYGPPGSGGGFAHLDWMQYKGLGYGVTHYYKDDGQGSGILHVYGISNRFTDTFDPTVGWSGNLKNDNWQATWDASYNQSGSHPSRTTNTKATIGLQNTHASGTISLNGSYDDRRRATSETRDYRGNFRINERLWGNTRLNVSGDAFVNEGGTFDRRLFGYRFDLANSSGPVTWSIAAEERFNPELTKDDATATSWRSTGKRPEVTVGSRPRVTVWGKPMSFIIEGMYGSYTERRFGNQPPVQDTRTMVTLQLPTTQFPLSRQLSLSAAGYVRGYRYGSGKDRLATSSTLSASYRPWTPVTLRVTYDNIRQQGETPFLFDRVTPRQRVTGNVQYNTRPFSVTLSSGYNLLQQRPDNVTLTVNTRPIAAVSLRVQGRYSLQQQAPVDVAGTVEWGTENSPLTLKLGGAYNFSTESLDRADAVVKWNGASWDIQYEGSYDFKEGEYKRGLFTVLRELDCDCRKVGLSYDQVDRTVMLEYRITALPQLGVKLGSQDDKLMFDLEGWQELVNQ